MTNAEIVAAIQKVMTDLKAGSDMTGKVPASLLATHLRTTRVKLTHAIRAIEDLADMPETKA